MEPPEVLVLFGAQHGVAHERQLVALGVSERTIRRRRASGSWVPVVPGVVRLTAFDDGFLPRAMALVLAFGPAGFLSGPTAGALHGLRAMPRARLEVTVPHIRRATLPGWVRVLRSRWTVDGRDVQVRADGLRLATPLRTLFGLASTFNQHRFERAAEDAWHLGLVSPQAASRYLDEVRRQGRVGTARFEAWLVRTGVRTRASQSGLELDLLDLVRRAGLPEPERQHPLRLRSGEVIHLDLAWPDARLAVEPGHSWWHGGDLRQRADMARDRACDEIGWRVVRYDENAARDFDGAQLARIYAARLG